jgi:3-dehydroquinate dehydratase-2
METTNRQACVLVIHGPNLNMLGTREPDVYGTDTLEDINGKLVEKAASLGVSIETFQSNHEGDIVEKIQSVPTRYQGVIINPAAYTHTSVAIHDALHLLDVPVIEVHLSNIYKREAFRHKSLVAPAATGQISGMGAFGYLLALDAVLNMIKA